MNIVRAVCVPSAFPLKSGGGEVDAFCALKKTVQRGRRTFNFFHTVFVNTSAKKQLGNRDDAARPDSQASTQFIGF